MKFTGIPPAAGGRAQFATSLSDGERSIACECLKATPAIMPSSLPFTPPRPGLAPSPGGGLHEWKISGDTPLLETGRETVLAARRVIDGREGWLHIVKDSSPVNVAALQRHFKALSAATLPPDWTAPAGWGVDDEMFYYLTLSGHTTPLGRWMAESQGFLDAVRLQWILQSTRAARFVLDKAYLGLALNADQASVVEADGALRLMWNKLLPVTRLPSQSHSDAVLTSLEQMLHHIFEGNGWPEPLRNAWIDASNMPAMEQVRRLEVLLEKMLLPPIQGGAEPIPPGPHTVSIMAPASILREPLQPHRGFTVTTDTWGEGWARPTGEDALPTPPARRHPPYGLWSIGAVIAVLALLLVVQVVSWFQGDGQSVKTVPATLPTAAVTHAPVATASPPVMPQPVTPTPEATPVVPVEDAAAKRQRLELEQREALTEATHRGTPAGVLAAALPLLTSQPQDSMARAAVQGVLEAEVRRRLDGTPPSAPAATPGEDPWKIWAEQGFPDARLLQAGQLLPTDPGGAATAVKQLADTGHAAALTLLGQLHARGLGVKQSTSLAANCYETAAAKGDRTACYLWAEALLTGEGVERNARAAIPWLRQAAGAGDPRAMNLMGNCLLKGNGLKADSTEAAGWFRKAADAGHASGMANLAMLLINGDGVRQDFPAALALVRRGSELNHPFSTHLLAFCYEKGFGVERDATEAMRHYQRAASLGHRASRDWCERHGISFTPAATPPVTGGSLPANRIEQPST